MRTRTSVAAALAIGLGLLAAGGCTPTDLSLKGESEPPPPPELADTVAEYANLVAGGSLLIDGHGLVAGLGTNGSSEVPPRVKKYLVEYMLKQKVGSATAGTAGATPSDIIRDKDTAVVRLVGVVPPGAPVGWKFDVLVGSLTRSGTRSLDGGAVLPFPLRLAQGEESAPDASSRAWAMAEGSVFVNPFLDPGKPADVVHLREGRLIGGGTVTQSRPLRIILREADWVRCNIIQRRINQRFGKPRRIANARNATTIELAIPPAYRDDYARFLQLVMHLPLQGGSGRWEAHARRIAEAMQGPGANHDGLALVWEAMGPEIVGVCRTLYASENQAAAFFAARAGLRLGDEMAAEVIMRFASTTGSPYQLPAIRELGRHRSPARAIPALRQLVDADNELVRIAAYEALAALGDESLITRVDVGGEFHLDLVKSRKSYVIYATQTREKKIVLFGKDMAVSRPIFFNMPNDLVTVADRPERDTGKMKLMVFRRIPRIGGVSEPFYLDFSVRSLVTALGRPAQPGQDGKVQGLGLTYGQIVAVLYRMCQVEKDIPARFVLQPPPGTQRIYRGATTVGRPDMPGG
jgi:hypothetical protein